MRLLTKERILLMLLFCVCLAPRLMYPSQTDFDSYWLHGMAESITIHGHAKWVFHPASLFGYYPLSYPSAVMFFLSSVQVLTGLSMGSVIWITGMLTGVLSTFLVYLLGRKIGGFYLGYLSAIIFTVSPQIVYYSSYIASGRFMLILFYLYFLILISNALHILGIGFDKEYNKKINLGSLHTRLRLVKDLVFSAIVLIFMFMVHRTSQLSFLLIAAATATVGIHALPRIIQYAKKHHIIKRFFIRRYEAWNRWVIIDLGIIVLVVAGFKVMDLLLRGRLWINATRMFDKIVNIISSLFVFFGDYSLPIIIIFFLLFGLVLTYVGALYYLQTFKLRKRVGNIYDRLYDFVLNSPKTALYQGLLLLTAVAFMVQFFGISYYTPSLEELYETDVLQGDNPLVLMINFGINFFTSVSVLTPFVLVGVIALFLKKKKDPSDHFLIFVILFFSNILIDKRYVRLFISPLFALTVGYGVLVAYNFAMQQIHRRWVGLALIGMFTLMSVAVFVPQARDIYADKFSAFGYRQEYWDVGSFIRDLDCNCSTLTTDEQTAGVTIFASSGVPGGTHSTYYFVNDTLLRPRATNTSEVIESLKQGNKVANLWYLPDWLFSGQFYMGRHARFMFSRDYRSWESQRIIESTRLEYYIHDKEQETTKMYESVVPVFNKIYDNPKTDIHDLTQGRGTV